jgi:hypothetical protein
MASDHRGEADLRGTGEQTGTTTEVITDRESASGRVHGLLPRMTPCRGGDWRNGEAAERQDSAEEKRGTKDDLV